MRLPMCAHLRAPACAQAASVERVLAASERAGRVHAAVLRLGLAYAQGSIRGGNARCVALLSTLRAVLQARRRPLLCLRVPSSPGPFSQPTRQAVVFMDAIHVMFVACLS
jgi:hypothetical protein